MNPVRFQLQELREDAERRAFLDLMLEHVEIDVTDFEASFLSTTIGRQTFSKRQRAVINEMMRKYQFKIQNADGLKL